MNLREKVTEKYREQFGYDPAYIVRAPGRVNLLGEHVDYNDGFVLPVAIDRATWLAFSPSQTPHTMLMAVDLSEEVSFSLQTLSAKFDKHGNALPMWSLYPAGIMWALGEAQLNTPAIGLSVLGAIFATVLGIRAGKRVRSPGTAPMAKRSGLFWLFLILYGITIIGIARPTDGKQATLLIILFVMLGQLSMGLLLSFSSVWWVLTITALALLGYFLLPHIFYLWMALLGGGGMIAFGLYIRLRW